MRTDISLDNCPRAILVGAFISLFVLLSTFEGASIKINLREHTETGQDELVLVRTTFWGLFTTEHRVKQDEGTYCFETKRGTCVGFSGSMFESDVIYGWEPDYQDDPW